MKKGTKRARKRHLTGLSPANILKLAAFSTAGLGLAGKVQAETTITFGSFTSDNVPISSIPGYGDNVSGNSPDYIVAPGSAGVVGTPAIGLDWLGPWDTYTAWDGRGNVAQSDFNGGSPSLLFTPSGTARVKVGSFYLDLWQEPTGSEPGSVTWSVSGPTSGTLASGIWTMLASGGRTLVSPNALGLPGEELTLTLQRNTGLPSYFALDNLVFDQVPEPSTWALGALGAAALGAAAMRRRRKA